MFKGAATQVFHDRCLNQGFCDKHFAEVHENANTEVNREFFRKAFLFVRTGILNPFLFNRPGKCEKIQILMQRANCFLKSFTEEDGPDDAYDSIYTLDSIIVFTMCYLSKICCIGALFQSDVRSKSEDPEIRLVEKLLYSSTLQEADISSLNPLILENFTSCNSGLIKLCYVSTLLFVRNNCIKMSVKTAIECIEKDILDSSSGNIYQKSGEFARKKGEITDEVYMYTTGLKYKAPYSPDLFLWRGQSYMLLKKYKAAYLDFYASAMLKPACETYSCMCTSLLKQNLYKEMFDLACYVCGLCKTSGCFYCTNLLSTEGESGGKKAEWTSETPKVCDPHCDKVKRKLSEDFKYIPDLIEASDSADSASEESSHKENENIRDLVEASDSEESYNDDPYVCEEIKAVSTPSKNKRSYKNKTKRNATEVAVAESMTEVGEDTDTIQSHLKEVSEALLQDCGYKALQLFCGRLKKVIESPKFYGFEESEIVCIKYSYGLAYCQSGGYDDLEKCIVIFKQIIEKHESITFPTAYYGLGLAYRKLNRFRDALLYLKIVKNILDKGIQFKVYSWPALTSVINETKPKVLEVLVENLIKECDNPPNPDGFCRYPDCNFQPTIYYSDPDFKGYISIFCSEQCCLQYHLQCWKSIKTDKGLTEKEFLDQACFTPDCDGVVIKVQSIDKKGDVSKEFLSDVKKGSKTKLAKWEKKTDMKEKKKRKFHSSRSESQENEIEKLISRKCFDVTEGSVSSAELLVSVNSNLKKNVLIKETSPDNSSISKDVSTFIPSNENTKDSSVLQSSLHSPSEVLSQQEANLENESNSCNIKTQSKSMVIECIKKNIYLYMSNFLQLHGPLKIDDPHLVDEMSSFPEDAIAMISDSGGMGEFLNNDLRFAFVGNTYVCVIADLGKAYKMYSNSSLSSDMRSLDEESVNYPQYFDGCGDASLQNFGLNPNAVEYMPSVTSSFDNKNKVKIFQTNCSDSKQEFSIEANKLLSVSTADGCINQNIVNLNRTSLSQEKLNLLNHFENGSGDFNCLQPMLSLDLTSSQIQSNSCTPKIPFEEFKPIQDTSHVLHKQISVSDFVVKTTETVSFDVVKDSVSTFNEHELGEKLLWMLRLYFSENMNSHRQSIDSCIKQYIIKKADNTPAPETDEQLSASMLDIKSELNEVKRSAKELRNENDVLTEQKSLLQSQLNSTKQQKQDLSAEVSVLKLRLSDVSEELENLKTEFSSKEEQLQSGRKFLLESLTDAHETIDKQKKEIDMLKSEKKSMKKNIDDLKSTVQSSEDKLKAAVANGEKKLEELQCLQRENAELEDKLQQTDLRILYLKKTEYLKKLEEKSSEASKSLKELSDGLLIVSRNVNPVVPVHVKRLASQLSTYIDELTAIKLDFMFTIDDQIDRVKNGASLMDLQQFRMKDIPELPSFENLIPNVNKFVMGSNSMSYDFGFNSGAAPPGLPVVSPVAPMACSISAAPASLSTFEANEADMTCKKSETLEIQKISPDVRESSETDQANLIKVPLSPALSASIPSSPSLSAEVLNSREERGFGGLDTIPKALATQEKKPAATGKNNYEKLLNKLCEQFPSYTQDELISFIKEFRMQRQGKLSGLPIDTIINHIGDIINERKAAKKKAFETKIPSQTAKTLVNKKLVPDLQPQSAVKKKTAWNIDCDSQKQWSGNCDECCVICYDNMANSSYKVACGHTFHEKCIKKWMMKKSDCPICRVLLLLPEDYPSLN